MSKHIVAKNLDDNIIVPPPQTKPGEPLLHPRQSSHYEYSKPKITKEWVAKYLTAGGIAGFVSRTCTAPIDRLKVLYQVSSSISRGDSGKQLSLLQGFQAIYREGGIRGFWRGNLTNVMKVIPESSIFFALFETFKVKFCIDRYMPTVRESVLSASCAGFITGVIMYPMETIKARWMVSPSGSYKNIQDCAKELIHKEGYKGLYKGLPVQLSGAVPYAAVNFTLYETAKNYYKAHIGARPPALWCLLFGAVASIFGQLVVYPSAVVRTRLQTQGTPGNPTIYKNGWKSCVYNIWSSQGIRGFYMGLLATYMKVIPAMGITFGVYEIAVLKFGL